MNDFLRRNPQNIEKAATVQIRESAEHTQGGGIFAFAGLQPLQCEKRLDGAGDDLAADGAVIILKLFDLDAALAFLDATFQTGIATATVTEENLNAIEGRDDASLEAICIEGLIAFQFAVDLHQHALQSLNVKAAETVTQHIVG